MKGLEIAKSFYEEYGREAIIEAFPDASHRFAIGLAGDGSECFGYDDEVSRDHDFEAGFCIWLTKEDYEKYGFKLEKVYSKLPKEYMGLKRLVLSPVGGNRHGVILIDDFYKKYLGAPTLPETLGEWFSIPTESLAAATNGEVFFDELGEFSAIRNALKKGFPRDVWLKKIAAHLALMEQAGLYNYERSLKREEFGAAQLCVFEFVKHTVSLVYLLNNVYEPFYKWAYRGMRSLERLCELESSLVALTELGNTPLERDAKKESMLDISSLIVEELQRQELTGEGGTILIRHAVSVQNKIKDSYIRNAHIMSGI